MPEAGASNKTETFTLESVEGGEVTLRKLTYGERVKRDSLAMSARGDSQSKSGEDVQLEMNLFAVQQYEFSKCVVSHNLTIDGQPIDFSKNNSIAKLDGVVGQEIADLIDKMNVRPSEQESKSVS